VLRILPVEEGVVEDVIGAFPSAPFDTTWVDDDARGGDSAAGAGGDTAGASLLAPQPMVVML
jgi:hypothetical protein